MNEIYIISVTKEKDSNFRTVGYFTNLDSAIDAVINNYCDIADDGYYKYAVIERIKEGIYQFDLRPTFFKFDNKTKQFIQLKIIPRKYQKICGFYS